MSIRESSSVNQNIYIDKKKYSDDFKKAKKELRKNLNKSMKVILNKKIAVNCESKEEADSFITRAKKLNKENVLKLTSWDNNGTCYDLNSDDYIVSFANKRYYKKEKYKILSFKEFMNLAN